MKKIVILCMFTFLLSGCLYPDEKRVENQIPYEEQMAAVEQAVVRYVLDKQVYPVISRENERNEFQKHLIHFQQLVPTYLQHPPGNSFEGGGVYQYLLLDIEKDPKVKLLDLKMTNEVQELQLRVNEYRRKHRFAPVKEVLGNGVFILNHEELNLREPPTVKSPFHPDHSLPLLIDENGKVIVDYTIDLNYALSKFEHNYQEGDDIRYLLINEFPFVPAYSLPYTIENGKAVIVKE